MNEHKNVTNYIDYLTIMKPLKDITSDIDNIDTIDDNIDDNDSCGITSNDLPGFTYSQALFCLFFLPSGCFFFSFVFPVFFSFFSFVGNPIERIQIIIDINLIIIIISTAMIVNFIRNIIKFIVSQIVCF